MSDEASPAHADAQEPCPEKPSMAMLLAGAKASGLGVRQVHAVWTAMLGARRQELGRPSEDGVPPEPTE